jgi:hypothetical protein
MEPNSNSHEDHKGDYLNEDDKEYPGYTSDKQWGNTDKEFPEADPRHDKIEDTRLAESGPVRNPNYHDLTNEHKDKATDLPSGSYSALKEKTLEDFNKTDPKRDINKDGAGNQDS